MVEAQNRQAVERDLVDEGEKTFDQAIHSLIEIHMLAVDVGDHGDGGRKEQKRAIALIGLSHQNFPLSQLGVASQRSYSSPDHHGGIQSGGAQNGSDHRRRGGLAVASGHGHAIFHAHQFREHLGPRDHRDVPPARFQHFGVGKFHCRRDHDH